MRIEEIAQRINFQDDDCWIWTGGKSGGRGVVRFYGRLVLTHRLMFEIFIGAVPKGFELHHRCQNPLCCNPEHLIPKTRKEHRALHPTPHPTHCKRGHEYVPENIRASKDGTYSCRSCFNIAQLKRYHANKY